MSFACEEYLDIGGALEMEVTIATDLVVSVPLCSQHLLKSPRRLQHARYRLANGVGSVSRQPVG